MSLNETIIQTIEEIPFAPYDRAKGLGGVTEDIYWRGKRVLRAASSPKSHCSGAVAEVVLKSLSKRGFEDVIPLSDIERFIEVGFIYNEETDYLSFPGAVVELGWGEWTDEVSFEPGALAQFWFEDEDETVRKKGHSLILLGAGERNGKQIFYDWSATDIPGIEGHTKDYHNVELIAHGGLRRIWYIANLSEDKINQTYGV